MDKYNYNEEEMDQGAVTLVFAFPQRIPQSIVQVLPAPAKGDIRRMCGRSAVDHHGISFWIKVVLLASTDCASGRVERSDEFVDDIKLHLWGTSPEIVKTVPKVVGTPKINKVEAVFEGRMKRMENQACCIEQALGM